MDFGEDLSDSDLLEDGLGDLRCRYTKRKGMEAIPGRSQQKPKLWWCWIFCIVDFWVHTFSSYVHLERWTYWKSMWWAMPSGVWVAVWVVMGQLGVFAYRHRTDHAPVGVMCKWSYCGPEASVVKQMQQTCSNCYGLKLIRPIWLTQELFPDSKSKVFILTSFMKSFHFVLFQGFPIRLSVLSTFLVTCQDSARKKTRGKRAETWKVTSQGRRQRRTGRVTWTVGPSPAPLVEDLTKVEG